MTTMLEKALGAALDAVAGYDEIGDDEMRLAIRAALLAIREPSEVMVKGGTDVMEGYMDDDLEPVFTAMIDAVLNEPSTP